MRGIGEGVGGEEYGDGEWMIQMTNQQHIPIGWNCTTVLMNKDIGGVDEEMTREDDELP